jgi:O-antigen biosynthesis protein
VPGRETQGAPPARTGSAGRGRLRRLISSGRRPRAAITSLRAFVRRHSRLRRLLRWVLRPALGLLERLRLPVPAAPSNATDPDTYAEWVTTQDSLSAEDRAAIRTSVERLDGVLRLSLLMPLASGTPAEVAATLASLRVQLAGRWELCVAPRLGASPAALRGLGAAARDDPRIRLLSPVAADGLAGLTNAALAAARGGHVALLEPGDRLAEQAVFEIASAIAADPEVEGIFSDEDRWDPARNARTDPVFKPGFDPELLLGQDCVGRLAAWRRDQVQARGGWRGEYPGAEEHDLALRMGLGAAPGRVRHLPSVLLHRSRAPALDAAASRRAVAAALAELGAAGARVEPAPLAPHGHRVRWPVPEPPLVSVIVPTRDRAALLRACAEGVLRRTDYPALELLVVDNGSTEPESLALFLELSADPRVRILPAPGPFNYAALNNAAARKARGELLLLLNNDTEVIDPGWMAEMVSLAIRPEVGAVGARLLFGDGRVQHGGVVLGAGAGVGARGVAGHLHLLAAREDPGYCDDLALVRSVSAATAACLMLRRQVLEAVGGLDAENLAVAFNDVDLCLRIGALGLRVLWTPFAELYHLESASRGSDLARKHRERFQREIAYMFSRWGPILERDPFYNPNFTLADTGCNLAFPSRHIPPWRRAGA